MPMLEQPEDTPHDPDDDLFVAELVGGDESAAGESAAGPRAEHVDEQLPVRIGSPFQGTHGGKAQGQNESGAAIVSPDGLDLQTFNALPVGQLVNESVWMPGYEDYAARGGAVAALFLGVMSILGGLLTPIAVLNGVAGLLLGAWGITSKRRRTAIIGMILCGIGILVSLIFSGLQAVR